MHQIADIAIFPWVRNLIGFYGAGELVGFADFPNVARWRNAIKERPAVQKGVDLGKDLRRTAPPTDEERELLYHQTAKSTSAMADRESSSDS